MLGKRQRAILQLMTEGWELGQGLDFYGRCWMQKGGLGKGGPAKHDISSDVVFVLYKKGYIKVKYRRFPTEAFAITELGKSMLRG